ncbi:MAG: DUF262 domain-containing protein [Alphaproteobacteria bacterium]|nr:DUF262 domain-containing protein [Alphaproteobacteria bacterium]
MDTIFSKIDFTLGTLMDAIELGDVGLPDIQRPFVWKNTSVRDLFDSMYRGFPVGYFLFWETGVQGGARTIGTNSSQMVPSKLIVDGQQRLTSLYAVIKGVKVIRENYQAETIEIAFNPLEECFEVADAATRQDKAYISNISIFWSKDADLFEIADSYLAGLRSVRHLLPEEIKKLRNSISRLRNLLSFPFTVLQLSATASEEEVSEIFVRINSKGKKLNQSDFILTLMSVFWDEGRSELEKFCQAARQPEISKATPFNYFFRPDPDQLLRVSIGVAFRRARLANVYSILRGKDLETGITSDTRREQQFNLLKDAQKRVLNLQYWHDFMKCLIRAGYRSEQIISSQTVLIFAYMLYLIGRTEFKVDEHELRRVISQWLFMSCLTGRYTSSPESQMEFDIARLRPIVDASEFINTLRGVCASVLTADFWAITLPMELATAAARSPSMFAYFASLNVLNARVLFSDHTVPDLMDPSAIAYRSPLERHHLFPKAYLQSQNITDMREINQIANFTLIEWGDNLKISDLPPKEYVPLLSTRFAHPTLDRMMHWHALPFGWESMNYGEFLRKRRESMARIICEAYDVLSGDATAEKTQALPLDEIIAEGESGTTEFKSTLRVNLHTGEKDARMELAVLKTIAAFVNGNGGTLVVGVSDEGSPVGIEVDGFPNEDKMALHLVNLLNDRIGPQHSMFIHPRFDDYEGARVLVVECRPGRAPIFVKDGAQERFFVRNSAATAELSASQTQEYIKNRF